MKTLSRSLRWLVSGVMLVLLSCACSASAQDVTGAIQGTITDPSGAVVPGATLTASSPTLGTPAKATTDSHGFYRFNALPPGVYVITVDGAGMSAKATDLHLSAGDLPNLDLKLRAGAQTVVDVNDSVAMVDVTQSKVETTINQEIIQAIPKGRSFQSVLTYAPGVRQEPLQSLAQVNGTSTPNAAGNANNGGSTSRTNGFQVDGASDSENVYLMDGVNISNVQGGGIAFNVPFEFSQDISIKSSGIEAQYGGALGGVVNVVPARGTSNWHGSLFMYYRTSGLNANDQCAISAVCGLRYNPATSSSTGTYDPVTGIATVARHDATPEYFVGKQDHYRYVDPGFTVGGPLFTEKVHVFGSFAPSYQRTRRDVISTFTGQGGSHTYYNAVDQDYAYARFDYAPTSKLRLFGGWEYAYLRNIGQIPTTPDSKLGQTNNQASTNPATFRSDAGYVNPGSIYSTGADYTLNSRTLVTVRYGYFFNNVHTLGTASGLRYLYSGNATSDPSQTLSGTGIPAAYQQTSTFSNLAANQPTFFNAYKRKELKFDVSHLLSGLVGTHNFKGGYSFTNTSNSVKTLYDYANVTLYYGQAYTVGVPGSCNAIIAANQVAYPTTAGTNCRGNYGYFIVHDGTDVLGSDSSNAHGLFVQDDWTVGHTGLTINAGIRFDREFLPPYAPGDPSINFPWSSKVAPRIGGAYAFHHGQAKVFASYGKFYDILKFSLPQGSFGGNYWHDCVYTLDNPNYNIILPTAPAGSDGFRHSCPTTGLAPGVASNPVNDTSATGGNAGRFIENLDLRAVNNSTNDPGVDPNIKPTAQHEFTFGAEYSLTPTLVFKTRYVRKRLDSTTEDIGLSDTYGFYIGNPGTAFADVLHRADPHIYDTQVASGKSPASQAGFLNATGICPECPAQPGAIRMYDGVEFRVEKTSPKYFVTAFYTYSALRGNYPGLTSTYITDGSGGRHNPNNNRSFDLPNMQFNAAGKPFGGPLPTDRPHSLNIFGSYNLKTFIGESRIGISEVMASGSPVSTCFPVGSTSTSACQFVEDQGGYVNFTANSNGDLVSGGVTHNRRTPMFSEMGTNLSHYVHVSKEHENRRMGAEINFSNLFNQHTIMGYSELPLTTAASLTNGTPTAANPSGIDFHDLLGGFDYTKVANGTYTSTANGATSARKILSAQYGLPNLYQTARQIRIKVAYTF